MGLEQTRTAEPRQNHEEERRKSGAHCVLQPAPGKAIEVKGKRDAERLSSASPGACCEAHGADPKAAASGPG
jgi:hypothetical protein